jgi:hypothetical protein
VDWKPGKLFQCPCIWSAVMCSVWSWCLPSHSLCSVLFLNWRYIKTSL